MSHTSEAKFLHIRKEAYQDLAVCGTLGKLLCYHRINVQSWLQDLLIDGYGRSDISVALTARLLAV